MRVGIATDHGGFGLKEELVTRFETTGHEVVDFGAHTVSDGDDYPDYVLPLARAVVAGQVDRGIAICGSGVGASVCANTFNGVRAALIHDHFSAKRGVEDDHMNILCMGGRVRAGGLGSRRDVFNAKFSQEPRHLRRLRKVAGAEAKKILTLEWKGGGSYVCNDS